MTTENTRAAQETLMWPQNLGAICKSGSWMPSGFQVLHSPKHGWMRLCIKTTVLGVNLAFLRTCHRGPWGLWGTRRVFPRQHLLPVDICGPLEDKSSGCADIPGTGTVSVQGRRWIPMAKPQVHILRDHPFGTGRT